MKFNLKISFVIMLSAIVISGCAPTLNLKYKPLQNTDNLLASVPSAKIKLSDFADKRENGEESTLIGEKLTGVRVGKQAVSSGQPVFEVIHEAMKSELTRNGHDIVDENEDSFNCCPSS